MSLGLRIIVLTILVLLSLQILAIATKIEFALKNLSQDGFRENLGQITDQHFNERKDILYSVSDQQINMYFKRTGFSYQIQKIEDFAVTNRSFSFGKNRISKPPKVLTHRVDVEWINANETMQIEQGYPVSVDNFYSDLYPSGLHGVRSFNYVIYKNVYPSVDLKWYKKDGHVKYDYYVKAGTDYTQIKLRISGANSISVNKSGELVIFTPLGEIKECAPVVTQKNKVLPAKWIVKGEIVSFNIQNLDVNFDYTIDPLIRLWGTYYGGTSGDVSNSVTTDASNNVFISGMTISNNNIATVGAFQTALSGNYDAFVTKFDAIGNRLWSTYYGGSGIDYSNFCVVDNSGNVVIGGGTYSSAGIATPGSHQPTSTGGGCVGGYAPDAFIAKFNPSGIRQWATYYGGFACEWATGCAIDQSNNIYFVGGTSSSNGTSIATPGSHQPTFAGGTTDGYIAKFDPSGNRLWASYYGGNSTTWDEAVNCSVDQFGNVYIVGFTDQNGGTGIATLGSHQASFGGGISDAYLAKFTSSGNRLWGTYYGGIGQDDIMGCTIKGSNLYISGRSDSNNGTSIATPASHQPLLGGNKDSFLASFDLNGSRQWSTYYGGSNVEGLAYCCTDPTGNIYLSGFTSSAGGSAIATQCTYQFIFGGGFDSYLAKFTPNGVRLWGTYYGGIGTEDYSYCATDNNANVYWS